MSKTVKLIETGCLLFIFSAAIAMAVDLSAKDAKIMKEAGIPVYKDAQYTNGLMGVRFGSSTPVEDTRVFYQSKFPSWFGLDKSMTTEIMIVVPE